MRHHHSWFGEGVDSGLLGGSAVAVWFLLRDVIIGKPLATPSILGLVLLFGQKRPAIDHRDFGAVVLYTAVHFLAFAAFGLVVTWCVHLSYRTALARFGLVVLFTIFEFLFYVVISTVRTEVSGYFPLFWVLSANLLATMVMGAYLWRRHPGLRRALGRTPLGV